MVFTFLLLALILLVISHCKNYFKAVRLAFRVPGPTGAVPLLGHVFLITDNKKLEDLGNRVYQLYGPVSKYWVSILPFFIVTEPKDLQVILGTSKYSTKNMFYSFLHNFLGAGLITTSGEKWKRHRRLIRPIFHIGVMKMHFKAFHKHSETMVESLRNITDVNIVSFVNKFVLDVLRDTVLGFSEQNDDKTFPFRKGKISIIYRVTRPWLLVNTLFKLTSIWKSETKQQENLQDYTRSILKSKQKCIKNGKGQVNSVMDMLINISNNNPEFTEEDVIDETCTFMLAGQDSVAAALAFSLYFLAAHQDVQNKVVEELETIFKDKNSITTFEDVVEMRYLEQCVKEALRLCPSVPIMARKITEDVTIGKYRFPAGTNILVSPFITHRLPHIFPDPLKFDPERFSPENVGKIDPYAYIPFSIGPRNCIGYKFALIELKIVISQILRNYQISLYPGFELNLAYRVTLRATGGIWLTLKERNYKKN